MEYACSTVGGFTVGNFSKVNRQRLFGMGYCFSASAPPFTCTAATYAFKRMEEKGIDMGIELRNKTNEFRKLLSDCKSVSVIGNDVLPFIYINTNGRNKEFIDLLESNKFFSVAKQHLAEDWNQEDYVRVCIKLNMSQDDIMKLANLIKNF